MKNTKASGCNEYRKEMILLGLQKRLYESELTETEKQTIKTEIAKLKAAMQLD